MPRVPDHVIVVFDEAYYEFVDSPDYPDSLAYVKSGRYPNTVVLRTFSKAYGIAGIRLGYGIAHPTLLAPLRTTTQSFPVNRLAQIAGLAALEDDDSWRSRSRLTWPAVPISIGNLTGWAWTTCPATPISSSSFRAICPAGFPDYWSAVSSSGPALRTSSRSTCASL